MLLKEIKDTNKWKNISCSCTGKPNIIKGVNTIQSDQSQCNPSQKSQRHFFVEIEKPILKLL